MKLKNEYTLTGMPADKKIAVPLNGKENFHGIIRLNESAEEVFLGLIEGENEDQLIQRLLNKYEGLDRPTAEKDVRAMIQKLKVTGLLED